MRLYICSHQVLKMLIGLLLIVLGIATADSQTATNEINRGWGKAVESFSLSILTAKTNYARGEPIILNILKKNIGKQDVTIMTAAPLALYEIKMTLPDKTPVSLTPEGKRAVDDLKQNLSLGSRVLKPGEAVSADVTLNEFYDLKSKRKYIISVTGKVKKGGDYSPSGEWLDLISNEIEIAVD